MLQRKISHSQMDTREGAGRLTFFIVMVISAAVFTAAVWGLHYYRTDASGEKGRIPVFDDMKIPGTNSMDEEISMLSERVAALKKRWERGETQDYLIDELQSLKDRMHDYRDKASPVVLKRINGLMDETDSIISGIRRKFGDVGERFDSLIRKMKELTGTAPQLDNESTTPEEDNYEKSGVSD